jgi:predicted ribosome quality control (RQC) complex YloA/Tae2 family protein
VTTGLQPLDATALRAVLAELRPALLPSRFERAQQSDARTVQLGLRCLSGHAWLELSWRAEAPRLLAIPAPPRAGEGSTLARQLQHGLRGLNLVGLEQQGWERVVELAFAPRPGDAVRRSLVLELMGRRSNLFLLDEERRVIALGHQVRESQSRLRPIGTGDPYQPPPPLSGDLPRLGEAEASWRRRLCLQPLPLEKALPAAYQGLGPALVRQLCEGLTPQADPHGPPLAQREGRTLGEADWQALHRRWTRWLEAVEGERFALRWGATGEWRCWDGGEGNESGSPLGLPINAALAAYYAQRLAAQDRGQRRETLARQLQQALEREQQEAERQQALLEAVPAEGEMRQRADSLLSLPSPCREQIDEAQKLYRRARKLKRSSEQILPRLEAHRQRLEALAASLTYLEQAEAEADLVALEEEWLELLPGSSARQGGGTSPGRADPRRADPRRADPRRADTRRADSRRTRRTEEPRPLELLSPGGVRLQVGRNHRQNEWISFRQARRGDLWFHAQELPGSHVVLKGSERLAGEADQQAAADLAAHFSRGRGNRRVPVVMVAVEELQRIPGTAPGTVRHRGGTVLWAEPERATALLGAPNVAKEGTP